MAPAFQLVKTSGFEHAMRKKFTVFLSCAIINATGVIPMLTLNDILRIPDDEIGNVKVKFNMWNGYDNPIELYKGNHDEVNKEWLFWREKVSNFAVGQIAICLVRIKSNEWLFTTAQRVTADLNVQGGIGYEGEELPEYQSLYGRTIIRYSNQSRNPVRYYSTVCADLEVAQILPDMFDDDEFPGYDNVCLTYKQLKRIIDKGVRSWIAALQNQKAVYLITDALTGKLYVGSATGENGMLLQRWSNYVADGHGGNKLLRELVDEKGMQYVQENFRYTILENFNSRVSDDMILQRESWWKNVLLTRQFGYNAN